MFNKALIALDYSAAEGPMLECLTDLQDMGVTRVVLTHIVRVGYGEGAGYGNKEALEKWLDTCAAPMRAAGMAVDIDVRATGDVAKDILSAAQEHASNLVVIGSRGQNMLRGLFLGSVAREVIRRSRLPVRLEWIEAIEKAGEAACERTCHAGLKRVLLATDFSPHASAAESAAIKLSSLATVVDLVHVISPVETRRYARWPMMVQAALDDISGKVTEAGGQAKVHLLEGTASEEIGRLAKELDADLIIVGKHGQNWSQSMLIGSTAAKLCEIARRPVLTVPQQSIKD